MTGGNGPRMPPRFVPTLTEVVQAPFDTAPDASQPNRRSLPPQVPVHVPAAPTPQALELLEDQLIHRVMQRVDVALERSLHEAVAQHGVAAHHALVPRLREEIEFVVRQAVADAVARELAERAHF